MENRIGFTLEKIKGKFKKEENWSIYTNVNNSRGHSIGDMKCDNCGEKIRGDYLHVEASNFTHRGNETDEGFLFHRKCSSDYDGWKASDKEDREWKKAVKNKENVRKELLQKIKEYEFEAEDLFDLEHYKSHFR